jgi:general stress protein 26
MEKNLENQEGINKIKELATDIDICLFCTNLSIDQEDSTRPMSTQEVDEDGTLWFFSDRNSIKNKEIENDKNVRLYYSHPSKSSYMVVNGEAEIIFDKQKVEDLWSPLVKTWFKEGKDDPNISILKIKPNNAYYWDVEGYEMINFFKMIASVATGTTLVDAKEGNIKL